MVVKLPVDRATVAGGKGVVKRRYDNEPFRLLDQSLDVPGPAIYGGA
jgi:hypothetical protein